MGNSKLALRSWFWTTAKELRLDHRNVEAILFTHVLHIYSISSFVGELELLNRKKKSH